MCLVHCVAYTKATVALVIIAASVCVVDSFASTPVGAIDPLQYSGSDVGAQINNAISANNCSAANPCHVVLPPTPQLSFSTTISIPEATTLECTEAGVSPRQGASHPMTLKYTGSGIAIQETGDRAVLRGCSLDAGNATTGIVLSGNNSRVEYVYAQGGIVGSKVLHMTRGDNLDLFQFTSFEAEGDIVYVDNIFDGQITNTTIYGYSPGAVSNHTSRTLVLDSNIGGLHVANFVGGSSGLHGMVVQNILGGSYPHELFFKDITFDCSYGDGIVFDSSLGAGRIEAHFEQLWVAGSGLQCNGTTVVNSSSNGIHISGGAQLYFSGGWIRANANNGVLIDTTFGVADVHIVNNMIQGNNWAAGFAPNGSGVNVTKYIDSLEVSGNQCSDAYESAFTGKNQNYCVAISPNGAQNVIVVGNVTQSNNRQPFLYPPAGSIGQMTFFGNTNAGADPPDNSFYGGIAAFSNASSMIAPWMVPSFGLRNRFLFGFGGNMRFDGSNWSCGSDTANNGCWGWLGSNDGSVGLYSIPTTNPASNQSLSSDVLAQHRVMFISDGTVDVDRVRTQTLWVEGSLTIGGKTILGSDGSLSTTHLTLPDVPPGELVVGQAGDPVSSVLAGQPGDCLVAGVPGQKPLFTNCPSGRPLSSWSLPVTGSQALGFNLTHGLAYRTAFELPAPGVSFNTITTVVLAADPNQESRYAVQIADTDGNLLCRMDSGRPLNVVGPADFHCAQETVYLPQGTYTFIWSSDVVPSNNLAPMRLRRPRGVCQSLPSSGNATALLLGSGSSQGQFLTSYFNNSEPVDTLSGAVTVSLRAITLAFGTLGDIPLFQLHTVPAQN